MASRSAVEAKRRKLANELARTEDGYVPTPPVLAEELTGWPYAMLNALPTDARVLEPSAGDGALVRAILDANAELDVLAIEPNLQRYTELVKVATNQPAGVRRSTLEEYAATCSQARFDVVMMNPPFSLPGDPQTWVRHILLAFDLLRPGGRLVSIAPHGGDPTGGAGRRLLQLVAAHGGIEVVAVDRADMRAGFPAKLRVVWLVKPIPRPAGRPSWLLNPATGEPVRVREFDHGPTGAQLTPVQEYEDRWWGHRLRVARFAGTCATCGRLLWRHDDGREGAMGWEANSCLEAEEFGLVGPTVGFCLDCVSHRGRRDRAVEMAQALWRKPGDEPASALDLAAKKRAKLVGMCAAKFAADTISAEPARHVEPTDDVLREAFVFCAKPPPAELYDDIRTAFNKLVVERGGVAPQRLPGPATLIGQAAVLVAVEPVVEPGGQLVLPL